MRFGPARAFALGARGFASRPPAVLSIQSHVCYGAAGNSAAVFPMRRLGVEVWPVNTVQFSNHTQYAEGWEGLPTPTEQIGLLAKGIERIGALGRCSAILSGYLGTEEQGGAVLDVVRRVKAANPAAIYCCDPVMGHPAKGCVVPEGVQRHHAEASAASADVLCPNVLELGVMTGSEPDTPQAVVRAARALLGAGSARLVLVKHLAHAGLSPDDSFEMLLVGHEEAWHIATPLLPFGRPPVGVGDLTSALFLVGLLQGRSPKAALEHTAGAYFEVMRATSEAEEYELQLVAAQDGLVDPPRSFEAIALDA
ncbi:hypothetical protein EMIHUDRAFT_448150 [Emiliania huxleyi CCMP1516]|uniref:pyridoxal kinase n=2 Tax=Emiliania huxleyi TaxID=2903 RepID=A0A0D3ITN6_EMIH1|nr:hypothetical protein EMIHUDRAFT_448150 [Emiliania huxleyi CCMP1516]EOD14621.1 hypothetical protein EMIHUDRAFT_448150 [Emiliania huxleyi CCMP1516]|mmetsp:Transcript_5518/g.15835  ORF Transcript_5518/g.15835 Transcript_5518/m.15835 type:complete len:310 (-) Transcript_5518:183-1112(-)|eukprot:XP_005767050.1 hypothetical protein EMIHUDRAFT_448150 [Emiliania huxleyi CCMP1516]